MKKAKIIVFIFFLLNIQYVGASEFNSVISDFDSLLQMEKNDVPAQSKEQVVVFPKRNEENSYSSNRHSNDAYAGIAADEHSNEAHQAESQAWGNGYPSYEIFYKILTTDYSVYGSRSSSHINVSQARSMGLIAGLPRIGKLSGSSFYKIFTIDFAKYYRVQVKETNNLILLYFPEKRAANTAPTRTRNNSATEAAVKHSGANKGQVNLSLESQVNNHVTNAAELSKTALILDGKDYYYKRPLTLINCYVVMLSTDKADRYSDFLECKSSH